MCQELSKIQIDVDRLRLNGLPMEAPFDYLIKNQPLLRWKETRGGLKSQNCGIRILAKDGAIYCIEIPSLEGVELVFQKQSLLLTSKLSLEYFLSLFQIEMNDAAQFWIEKDSEIDVFFQFEGGILKDCKILWKKRIENLQLSTLRHQQNSYFAIRNAWVLSFGFSLIMLIYLFVESSTTIPIFLSSAIGVQAATFCASMFSCMIYVNALPWWIRILSLFSLSIPPLILKATSSHQVATALFVILVCHLIFWLMIAWFRYLDSKIN